MHHTTFPYIWDRARAARAAANSAELIDYKSLQGGTTVSVAASASRGAGNDAIRGAVPRGSAGGGGDGRARGDAAAARRGRAVLGLGLYSADNE